MSDEPLTPAEMGAKGGKARAQRMTPEERSERARRAVEARWKKAGKIGEVYDAPHNGAIRIGLPTVEPGQPQEYLEIPCAVLRDATRLLSETGIINALGLYRSGAVHTREKEAADGGAQLPLFVANKNLKPFIDLDLADVLKRPIWYRPETGPNAGTLHKGVRAELLPKICNVWLKARDAGAIRGVRQELVIINADIIQRGLAEVGITALVDEATGFQDARARDALAKILEQFVAKEIQQYVKLFPLAYFKGLCRLRGVPFSRDMRLPRYFGHLTNNIIYARLAPGVLPEVQRKNPTVNGRRKNKNYNWLTPNVGHPKVLQLLGSVTTLMELAGDDYNKFMELLDRFHPVWTPMPLFDPFED